MLISTVAALGLMGLGLAIVGLYGLVAYAATRRTREIGIRMAIGAGQRDVLQRVIRQAMVLATAGLQRASLRASARDSCCARRSRPETISAIPPRC